MQEPSGEVLEVVLLARRLLWALKLVEGSRRGGSTAGSDPLTPAGRAAGSGTAVLSAGFMFFFSENGEVLYDCKKKRNRPWARAGCVCKQSRVCVGGCLRGESAG